MGIFRGGQRFSKVPWLGPQDLEPKGLPEATVERGQTITHVMRVPQPFGRYTNGFLVVAANKRTMAITSWIETVADDGTDDTVPVIRQPLNTDDDEEGHT